LCAQEHTDAPARKRAPLAGAAQHVLSVVLQAMGVSRADMCRVGLQGVTLTQPGRCSDEPIYQHATKPGKSRKPCAASASGVIKVQWKDAGGQTQVRAPAHCIRLGPMPLSTPF
jgi:hypothetical protein